jgi:serine/threonine protein kinase
MVGGVSGHEQTVCPPEELLAAFLSGLLAGKDLESVEAHLSDCEDCVRVVASAAHAQRMGSNPALPAQPFFCERVLAERFELGELIAVGGMGTVYRGRDRQNGAFVAIKALASDDAADSERVARFVRESQILARLNHPNIVKMLDVVAESDQRYIVMEYTPGGSLRERLRVQPCPPLRETLGMMLELTDALSRAHHLGVVHRDIKPENVLIGEDGTPRLSDFGVARMGDQRLTRSGDILGTLFYLSPEAVQGLPLDQRTDLWALGVMLYEVLSGRRPFFGPRPAAVLQAIVHEPAPSLESDCPRAPTRLVRLVSRMLIKDPAGRIGSARQVAAELEAILKATEPASADVDSAVEPRLPAHAPSRALPRVGERIGVDGRFEIVKLLGQGAMGRVYRAHDHELHRDAAIKFLLPTAGDAAGALSLLQREAHAMAQLNHENIVQIFDCGVWNSLRFLVMEYLDGESLELHLASGALDWEATLRVVTQIASALVHAHGQGIVHLDIKPSNVFVLQSGRVKLLDFGIARLVSREQPREFEGTPAYMAPEQWGSGAIDGRADIWSLGLIFFQAMTGVHPFAGLAPAELFRTLMSPETPLPKLCWQSDLPTEPLKVIERALAKQPGHRYPDVASMFDALQTLEDQLLYRERRSDAPRTSGWVTAPAALADGTETPGGWRLCASAEPMPSSCGVPGADRSTSASRALPGVPLSKQSAYSSNYGPFNRA